MNRGGRKQGHHSSHYTLKNFLSHGEGSLPEPVVKHSCNLSHFCYGFLLNCNHFVTSWLQSIIVVTEMQPLFPTKQKKFINYL